jgi:hypothetical protein
MARQQYPQLANAQIKNVYSQVVSGFNYKIIYKAGNNLYEVTGYSQSWTNTLNITSFKQIGTNSTSTSQTQPQLPQAQNTFVPWTQTFQFPASILYPTSSSSTSSTSSYDNSQSSGAAPSDQSSGTTSYDQYSGAASSDQYPGVDSSDQSSQSSDSSDSAQGSSPQDSGSPGYQTTNYNYSGYLASPGASSSGSPSVFVPTPISAPVQTYTTTTYTQPSQSYNQSSTSSLSSVVSYSIFSNYSNQQFQQSDSYARQQYPYELKNAQISSAYIANVPDGTYFKITYSSGNAVYEAVVMFSSSAQLRMVSFKTLQTTQTSTDPLCQSYDSTGVCQSCVWRSVFNAQGICTQVNPQCNTFSQTSGACLSCYSGYALNNGNCYVSQNQSSGQTQTSVSSDPNCLKTGQNGQCLQCSFRFFINSNGICQQVSDQCNTFSSNGNCTLCYKGFVLLSNGACTLSQ